MKKTLNLVVLATLLLAVSAAQATIRYVSASGAGAYTLPSAAHAAAAAGDTILIGPGMYSETAGISVTKRLTWIGAGWDQTILTVSGGNHFQFSSVNATGSTFEGIRINGSSSSIAFYNATANCDSITARRCMFVGGTSQITILWQVTGARLYLEDCAVLHNYQFVNAILGPRAGGAFRNCVFAATVTPGVGSSWAIGDNVAATGVLEVYNSVFLNWNALFQIVAGSPSSIIINNAAFDFNGTGQTWGTLPGSSVIDYNASPASPAVPGTNGVTIPSNPFVNYDTALNYLIGTTNLHLAGGSNLINAGNPGILDLDASVSDIGAYGGPRPLIDNGVPNYPWAVNIVTTPNVVGQGTPVNASALGRVGPQ